MTSKRPRARRTSGNKRAPSPQKARDRAQSPIEPAASPSEPVVGSAPSASPLIVGVGGSAGSLGPLRDLLAAVPPDCGMAFVVVSHQAPTGQSMLPGILAKCTEMPVREIVEEIAVEANHVYVEPRGRDVTIRAGVLSLEPAVQREVPHLPIDLFFHALAQDQGSAAVGIVLSGTGRDGTLGLAAIRAASGLGFVQDPATAEFDGMPMSAIQAGASDFVLSAAEMPRCLLDKGRRAASPVPADTTGEMPRNEIQSILAIMHQRGGHDFSEYKHATLGRRIERRMQLHGIERLEGYARYLEESAAEIDALWHDWMIGVSSFFREPQAFEALESALPELLAGREDGSPLRIWVAACATGEEAYSVAMVVLEVLHRLEMKLQVQVFATDLDPAAVQVARTARYPAEIAANVGKARLARFFAREGKFYRVEKELRDLVVFAVQDSLHDPPLTRVDLVSCRNLLIYLEASAQRRLLRSFHYSLNPRGLVLLGSSEGIGGSEEFFSPLDPHWKLYRRNDTTAPQPPLRWPVAHAAHRDSAIEKHLPAAKTDLERPLHRALAQHFGPPAVIVDPRGQIQQVHGQVGSFLQLPPGRLNVNVVDMAREGLRLPLASALREALEADGRAVERSIGLAGSPPTLHLRVSRLLGPEITARLFLVSFETVERAQPEGRPTEERVATVRTGPRGAQLEQELRDTRYDLQGSIAELQAANEELASANEEAQSANEELQSTNEELQTAKEETQSLNEELHTVNTELTQKLESFERATDDLVNLMNNIEVATIFLDAQLRVKRFTLQARRLAHLIDADIGRPLEDLATLIDYPDLLSDAARVIETLQPSETQAGAADGSWYLVRMRPYRTARNVVEGAVVTFVDITDAKRSERLQAARDLAESMLEAVSEPFLVLDGELRVVRANRAYYQSFQVEPAETDGLLIGDLGTHQWNIPTLRERLEKTLQEGAVFEDFEVEIALPELGRRRVLLSARPLSPQGGTAAAELVLLGIQKIRAPQAEAAGAEVIDP